MGGVEQAHFGIYIAGRPDLAREQCIQQGMESLVDDDAGVLKELRSQERHARARFDPHLQYQSKRSLARTLAWVAHGF